jgi:hypothetical protein
MQNTNGTIGKLTWTLKNETLTISGEGNMPDEIYSNYLWDFELDSVSEIVIENGVTNIGGEAFWGFVNWKWGVSEMCRSYVRYYSRQRNRYWNAGF